jgi:hypothetical protein
LRVGLLLFCVLSYFADYYRIWAFCYIILPGSSLAGPPHLFIDASWFITVSRWLSCDGLLPRCLLLRFVRRVAAYYAAHVPADPFTSRFIPNPTISSVAVYYRFVCFGFDRCPRRLLLILLSD